MNSISNQQFSNWARKISTSDERAFKELFDATFEFYVRYAWRFTKNKETAMDLAQESFIKLWQIRTKLDPSQSLKTYMYRIVKNKALNHLRDVRQHDLQASEMQIVDEDAEVYAPSDDAGLIKPLKKWVLDLPDRQKEAFTLSRFEGLTHDEIAVVMDVSPRTVNNHITAAMNTLQERYKNYKKVKDTSYE